MDFTGVGEQPIGYDQWSALYSTYRVHSVKVAYEIENRGDEPLVAVMFPTNLTGVGSASSLTNWMSLPNVKY